jgi:hypothetical protein
MLIRTMSPVRPKECRILAILRQDGFLPTRQAASLTSLSQSSTNRRFGIDRNDVESTSADPCDWLYRPSLANRTGSPGSHRVALHRPLTYRTARVLDFS